MSEYEIEASETSLSLNESNTVGAFAYQSMTDNQTRTTLFTPETLLEWAKAVNDAYEDDPAIEIVFTPKKPMVAKKVSDTNVSIGIGVAPRLRPDDYDGMIGDSE
jgi:hypothetical protein